MNVIKVQERKDIGINLHPMKKIEIIVSDEYEQLISSMMEKAKVTGFMLFRNISGKGHNSFQEGKLLVNDRTSLIMFLVVAPEEVIAALALGMKTLFQQNSGVMFVSDVDVARIDYLHSITGA